MSNISLINQIIFFLLFLLIFSAKLDSNRVNQVLLAKHNEYRKKHGVPELTLDNELIKIATDYSAALAYKTDKFSVKPSGNKNKNKENLGENIFTCTSVIKTSCYNVESTSPVDEWYNEIKNYDFSSPKFSINTARFSQVIWKETTKMGCGASVKDDDGVTYKVVCNYYSAGNVLGHYGDNAPNLTEYDRFILLNNFSFILILLLLL